MPRFRRVSDLRSLIAWASTTAPAVLMRLRPIFPITSSYIHRFNEMSDLDALIAGTSAAAPSASISLQPTTQDVLLVYMST